MVIIFPILDTGICFAILSVLLFLAFEDLKNRAISLWGLIIFLSLSFMSGFFSLPMESLLKIALYNVSFVLIQLLLVSIYFSIKAGVFVNIADRYLGWGDILFFFPLCFLFSPFWFMSFYVCSLTLTLFGYFLYITVSKTNKQTTVPLAGGQALCLVPWLIAGELQQVNFYEIPSFFF